MHEKLFQRHLHSSMNRSQFSLHGDIGVYKVSNSKCTLTENFFDMVCVVLTLQHSAWRKRGVWSRLSLNVQNVLNANDDCGMIIAIVYTFMQKTLGKFHITVVRICKNRTELLVVEILKDSISTEHEDISRLNIRNMVYLHLRIVALLRHHRAGENMLFVGVHRLCVGNLS